MVAPNQKKVAPNQQLTDYQLLKFMFFVFVKKKRWTHITEPPITKK